MRIGRPFAGIALLAGLLTWGPTAHANPPADDFLNPQEPGPRLTLMPFIGPGFRANYDHRFPLERDSRSGLWFPPEGSELRTQLIATVAVPFAEVSANVDVRFFLMQLGGSVGYHDEWHMLQFTPDPQTGHDRAGQERVEIDPTKPALADDPN